MVRQSLALASLAALAACATSLEDIGASEPVESGSFHSDYRAIAECVNFRIGHQLLIDPSNRIARIVEPPGTWLAPTVPTYELSFRQVSETEARVALRQRAMVPRGWGRDIWAAVEDCGARLAHAGAPAQR